MQDARGIQPDPAFGTTSQWYEIQPVVYGQLEESMEFVPTLECN